MVYSNLVESYCIDRIILGTPSHLLCENEKYTWVSNVPQNSWHLSGKIKNYHRCLDTLLMLNEQKINIEPPKKFVDSISLCIDVDKTVIPWQKIMPKDAHRAFARHIISQVNETIGLCDQSYYNGPWSSGNELLSKLEPARVDKTIWSKLIDNEVGNWHVVQTFKPNKYGVCEPVVYNRFGTRTGRMTIESGPSILTLRRDYRNMLRSRYDDDGIILNLDFSNLEARILLYEGGGHCNVPDLYSYINSELFNSKMKRDDIKGAIISELYGQSKYALGQRLGIESDELNNFVKRIRQYFNTDNLLARIKEEYVKLGYITNRYGRRVRIEEPIDKIFKNSYTQSTGVDVTILGFNEIINTVKSNKIHPLFLLHDAIIIDCHKEDLAKIQKIDNLTIKGYVQKFYFKLTKLETSVNVNNSSDNQL